MAHAVDSQLTASPATYERLPNHHRCGGLPLQSFLGRVFARRCGLEIVMTVRPPSDGAFRWVPVLVDLGPHAGGGRPGHDRCPARALSVNVAMLTSLRGQPQPFQRRQVANSPHPSWSRSIVNGTGRLWTEAGQSIDQRLHFGGITVMRQVLDGVSNVCMLTNLALRI